MNVDTLLEAAKYLEEQEEKAKQQRQIQTIPDIAPRLPIIHQPNHVQIHHQQQPQQQQQLPSTPQQQPQQQQVQQQPQPLQSSQNHQQTPTIGLIRTIKSELSNPSLTVTTQQQQQQQQQPPPRVIKNSFDFINRLVIDESGEHKRKQPPIVFRAGTREVHNKLEKDRRAHLKECFDLLKKQLPKAQDERKSSNLSILHSAIRHINSLKKRERELEHEMEQLARQKIAHQQKIAVLKKDFVGYEGMDFAALLPELTGVQGAQGVVGGVIEEMMETTPIPEIKLETEDALLLDAKNITAAAMPRTLAAQTPQVNGVKENTQVQTRALSVVPLPYPMNQVVLQKVALVPKNLSDLSPLVSSQTTVAHLITPQQIGGKVVPIVNAQYVVKPVVVVSTPSRPS